MRELENEILSMIFKDNDITIRRKTYEDFECDICNRLVSCGTSICPKVRRHEVEKRLIAKEREERVQKAIYGYDDLFIR